MKWIDINERPLFTIDEKGDWTCTEDGDKEFFAAVPYVNNTLPNQTNLWWIRHCVIEDNGLCVVGDNDIEPAGWDMKDITHWMSIPTPPNINK